MRKIILCFLAAAFLTTGLVFSDAAETEKSLAFSDMMKVNDTNTKKALSSLMHYVDALVAAVQGNIETLANMSLAHAEVSKAHAGVSEANAKKAEAMSGSLGGPGMGGRDLASGGMVSEPTGRSTVGSPGVGSR